MRRVGDFKITCTWRVNLKQTTLFAVAACGVWAAKGCMYVKLFKRGYTAAATPLPQPLPSAVNEACRDSTKFNRESRRLPLGTRASRGSAGCLPSFFLLPVLLLLLLLSMSLLMMGQQKQQQSPHGQIRLLKNINSSSS